MSRGDRSGVTLRALAIPLVVCALVLGGCLKPLPSQRKLSPKVFPPAVAHAGTLRVGVDLSYPPFGGTAQGRPVGIDVDVASAVAARLGLKVEFVDVKASQLATALAGGRIDAGLSAPFSADLLSRATIAGTYISDGPALFSTAASTSVTPTDSADTLGVIALGAQKGSAAYWQLVEDRGEGAVQAYPTLRAALAGLSEGEVDAVGGDALVGAYIARDLAGVHYAGALAGAKPLGIAVSADNTTLGDAIRTTLDSLAADGILDAIRAKWVGSLPELPLGSGDASASPAPGQ